MENEAVKQNICNKAQWYRILYMVLFAVVLYLVLILVGIIVIVQLVFALFSGKPNENIADFASDLSTYVYQLVAFLTYTENRRPFPFNSWNEQAEPDFDDDDYTSSVEEMGDAGQPSGDDRKKTDH
ncbi:DUF4389 domain-containing protein [Methylophaga sp. OBS4]|uniref:DUF4389 domain-containing protein n=1 Tax=Methylophaga sp. OBS4 TaxID=2991935 RepID=UPI002251C884|nr:DUF4389 domain-containing protein [Methylophaga sp. OBS4]MCX4186629.1 DUF4389 domain-containing protein [Methylophaga sp. OBS4]